MPAARLIRIGSTPFDGIFYYWGAILGLKSKFYPILEFAEEYTDLLGFFYDGPFFLDAIFPFFPVEFPLFD